MEKTTAETTTNYVVNPASPITISKATLQSDNQTVVLTLGTALTNNTAYTVKVVKNAATDTSGDQLAQDYYTSVLANDTTAPSVVSVSAAASVSTSTVFVKFSEPVQGGSYTVNGSAATATVDANDPCTMDLTTSSPLAAGQSYSISFNGVYDYASNYLTPVTQNFTVTSDTTAPAVTSITGTDQVIKVVFNKAIDSSSLSSATYTAYKMGDDTNYAGTPAASLDPSDSTNKTVLFNLSTSPYVTTSNSVTVYVSISGIKDLAGNTMTAVSSQAVTVTKDTVKPAFVSASASADNTKINIVMSKEVPTTQGSFVADVSAVDSNGVSVTLSSPSYAVLESNLVTPIDGDGNTVQLQLSSALKAGTYTFYVAKGAIADAAATPNTNDAFNFTVTLGAPSDSTKPTVSTVGSTSVTSGVEQFNVTYAIAVKGGAVAGSATDPTNYMVDGVALPTGTVISLDSSSEVATIKVPAGTFTADKTSTLTIANVQSAGGTAMDAYTNTSFAVKDNTAPTLVTAQATTSSAITLTFSEGVSAGTGNIQVTDGTNSATSTGLTATGNTVTATFGANALAPIDFTKAVLSMPAGYVVDNSGAANPNGAIAYTNNVAVADKFVNAPTVSASTTGSSITVTITKNANASIDKEASYAVYVLSGSPAPTLDKTTIGQYTAVATYTASAVTSGTPMTLSTTTDSTGATLVNTPGQAYNVYVVEYDTNGNAAYVAPVTATF